MSPALERKLERVTASVWTSLQIIPSIKTGATDG